MTNVVETILIALGPGTFEGLLAVAIVLTYRSTGVVNLALGTIAVLGAVLAASLAPAVTPVAAIVAGILVASVCAAALTAATARYDSMRRYPWSLLVTTVVALALGYALHRAWDTNRTFPAILPVRLIGIGSYQITPLQAIGIVSGVVITALAVGVLRAGSSSPSRPRLFGSPAAWVVLLAGAMAGFCACCLAVAGFGPDYMLMPTLVAVLAALVARLRSPEIAFLAAVVVEVVRNLTIHFRLPHSGYTVAFVAAMLLAACLYLLQYAAVRAWGAAGAARQQRLDY